MGKRHYAVQAGRGEPPSHSRSERRVWVDQSLVRPNIEGYSPRHEIHGDAVDAVAQMGRRRSVVKDVSEVAPAACAMGFGSNHPVSSVDRCLDGTFNRIIEAGPAGPAFELLFRLE